MDIPIENINFNHSVKGNLSARKPTNEEKQSIIDLHSAEIEDKIYHFVAVSEGDGDLNYILYLKGCPGCFQLFSDGEKVVGSLLVS